MTETQTTHKFELELKIRDKNGNVKSIDREPVSEAEAARILRGINGNHY